MDYFWNLARDAETNRSILSQLMLVTSKKDKVINDWKEPYHAGRGVGRYSTSMGSGVIGTA